MILGQVLCVSPDKKAGSTRAILECADAEQSLEVPLVPRSGSGQVQCTYITQKKTSVDVPQLGAVLECTNAAPAYYISTIFRLGSARVLCARPRRRREWIIPNSALSLNAQMLHQLTTDGGYLQLSAVLECADAEIAYYF